VPTVYTLAGLGADQRMLDRLKFPEGFLRQPLPWLPPNPRESIADYAARLAELVTDPSPVLLGVSFGGVVALELSRHVNAAHTIVVASFKNKYELPWYFRLAGRVRLHRVMPVQLAAATLPLVYWFNGATERDSKRLIKDMLQDSDPHFLRWAMARLLFWSGCAPGGPVTHIHGTADRLLPYRYVRADIALEQLPHFMVHTHPEPVNKAIWDVLRSIGR